jgi:membrane-associated phospholipid phosphatase
MALFLFFCGAVQRTVTFARCFLVVNVMGFITYLVYPAAPPWYVAAHGFGTAEAGTMPSPAGAERFDALFGTHFFDRMYGHSIDVYGAIPSLHVAYPLLAFLLALRTHELRWVRVPAGAFSLLMCFSAVYLQHHYVIDVLFGTTYAVITLLLVSAWERRRVVQTP